MKKITKPATREECFYVSDFQGVEFGKYDPHVELKLTFNYGSIYDGTDFSLHLTDNELDPIMDVIRKNLSEEYKIELEKQLSILETNQEKLIESKEWIACEYGQKAIHFLKRLLTDLYKQG
jgi:hypothetical protein